MPHHWISTFCQMNPELCHRLYWLATVLGTVGSTAEKVSPNSPVGIAATIAALVALIGAVGSQIDQHRKRTAMMEKMRHEIHKERARSRVTENAVGQVRKHQVRIEGKQVQIEQSIRGLELIRDVLGVKEVSERPYVLVVDDDPYTLRSMHGFLMANLNGPNIILAENIQDAILAIRKHLPNWMFLDLKIGDDSGLEIVPEAKSLNPKMEIIVITGLNDPNHLKAAVAMGAEVFPKPVDLKKFDGVIRRMRKDFGGPDPSSEAIPILGASGIRPGIEPDASSG